MPRRGTFYAVTPAEAERLLGLVGDDQAVAREGLDLYSIERQKSHCIAAVDKAWDVIHRCLTDGTLRGMGHGTTPLAWAVLGGKSLYGGSDFIVCYVMPQQVAQVAPALDEIVGAWFAQRYWQLENNGYRGPINNEELEYAWDYFTNMRNLYTRAAANSYAVIFVTDQ
jgi:hypothetical protein